MPVTTADPTTTSSDTHPHSELERDPRLATETHLPVTPDALGPADRRRLRLGWSIGAAPALAIYTWMLTAGRADFGHRQHLSGLFDAQARSLFHGRWDVPYEAVSFEGFLIDGKYYAYFGPFPAIVRMPLLAVTDAFDGRLVALSMLLAMVTLTVTSFRLFCVLRATVRGAAPVTRREVQLSSVMAMASLIAPPFFLSSATLVYHEAAIWGVALTVAAFGSVARFQRDPTRRRLAHAAVAIMLAMLARQAIGLGPLVALGLAGLVLLVRQFREEDRYSGKRVASRQVAPRVGALALAVIVAAGPSVAVNYVKLGQLFGLPMAQQVHTFDSERRQAVLDANATYFGLEFAPTTARAYLRPDGISFREDFPWIDFPRDGPTLAFPEPTFDGLDWASSLPATAPALVALSLGALTWAVLRRKDGLPNRAALLALSAGAVASTVGVLTIPLVANRYLTDFYPLVLIGGLVGVWALSTEAPAWRTWFRRLALGGVIGLTALGVVINLALTLSYQRERGWGVQQDWLAEYIGWRLTLPGSPRVVHLPPGAGAPPVVDGTVLIVGDCEHVSAGVRDRWLYAEQAPDDSLCRTALGS